MSELLSYRFQVDERHGEGPWVTQFSREIARRAERQARKDTRGYLDRIVAAYLFNERDEADKAGVLISKQQVRRAVEDAQRSRPERLLRRTRRQLRPEIEELLRGVEGP